MKTYPSIEKTYTHISNAYIFDKLDGSNLRFEWSRKQGWHKYGTRRRMFDETDEQFKHAIPIFHNTIAQQAEKIAKEERWDRVVVFAEYHGPNSFAGTHTDPPELMRLDVIDVSPHRYGILPPDQFLKLFDGKLPTAKFLGRRNWGPEFVQEVYNGTIEGVTFEGVVGKSGGSKSHDLVMVKAKSKAWIDKVIRTLSNKEATELLNS